MRTPTLLDTPLDLLVDAVDPELDDEACEALVGETRERLERWTRLGFGSLEEADELISGGELVDGDADGSLLRS